MGKSIAWKEWNPTDPSERLATKPGLYAPVLNRPNALRSRIAYIGSAGGKSSRTLAQRLTIRAKKSKLPWLSHHVFGNVLELDPNSPRAWLHHPNVDWERLKTKPKSGRSEEGRIFAFPVELNEINNIETIEKWLLWLHFKEYGHFPRLNRKCPPLNDPKEKPPENLGGIWKSLKATRKFRPV